MSDTSSQVCYTCKCSPKNMNNIEKFRKKENVQEIFYKFGLSTLHAWIRFFECLLHTAYRLEFKQWRVCKITYSFSYSSNTDNNECEKNEKNTFKIVFE